jgi:hypothetical protein
MTVKRCTALVVLVSMLPACMGTYRVAPEKYLAANRADRMLVMDNAGQFYEIEGPAIIADSVKGIEAGTSDSVAVPVSGVEDALVRHKSKARTIAMLGVLGAVTGLAVVGVSQVGKGYACSKGNSYKDVIQGTGTDGCDAPLTIPNGQ